MVERYVINYNHSIGEQAHPSGDFVHYSDYVALERQIAELRAENLRLQNEWDNCDEMLQAVRAENARLKALPLKDEVERVVEEMLFLAEAEHMCLLAWNQLGSAANYDGITERARSILSRLRAGVQEGWRAISDAPKDGTKILYVTKFDDIGFCHWDEGYNEDDEPCWWDNERDDEVCPVAWLPANTLPASPSVSEGGSRNG